MSKKSSLSGFIEKPDEMEGSNVFDDTGEIGYAKENFVKLVVRDSVFSDLFKQKKYLIQLYRTLNPEDVTVTEDDLTDITIRNVFVNEIYNDLGYKVRGKLIILCECQTLWSVNIVVRIFLYLARSYQLYFGYEGADLYGTKKVFLPKPELYVIYVGDKEDIPEEITLSDEFWGGGEAAIDIHVKVIRESDSTDIINQYIIFTKVYGEQREKYGRTRTAILETIRICKDRNILREYLKSREKEVEDIMFTLFDEKYMHYSLLGVIPT